MISVGIIGGTGYTGKYLIEYCSKHPFINEYTIYANSTAGKNIFEIFPRLDGVVNNQIIKSAQDISFEHDVYYLALPHGESLNVVPKLLAVNNLVIDLGVDYRLDDESLYKEWYNFTHTSADLLEEKVYGLADCKISYNGTNLISNPGCYPTGSLLALLPLVKDFSSSINTISINAYSGTSGAGKSAKAALMFSEMHSNVRAYNVNSHRHLPEIKQELNKNGYKGALSFTTHLLPVSRGIYTTCSIHLTQSIDEKDILCSYNKHYSDSKYVRLRSTPPDLSWVTDTNFCDINVSVTDKTIIVTSAIDNLIKGASGQAIQNMNQYFGWESSLSISDTVKIKNELDSVLT